MILRKSVITFSVILLAMTTGAMAQDTFPYIGVGSGTAKWDLQFANLDDGNIISADFSNSSRTVSAFAGYRFWKYAGFEFGYQDLGEIGLTNGQSGGGGSIFKAGSFEETISVDGVTLSLIGAVPLGSHLEVTAKFGRYKWQAEFNATNTKAPVVLPNDEGSSNVVGLGAAIILGPVQVGGAVERYARIVDESVQVVSGNVAWRFN